MPKNLKNKIINKNKINMDYITYSKRLDYLLEMIEKGVVCSPKQLSDKFDCCEKTARNMICKLKEKGYKIEYCRSSRKYLIEK